MAFQETTDNLQLQTKAMYTLLAKQVPGSKCKYINPSYSHCWIAPESCSGVTNSPLKQWISTGLSWAFVSTPWFRDCYTSSASHHKKNIEMLDNVQPSMNGWMQVAWEAKETSTKVSIQRQVASGLYWFPDRQVWHLSIYHPHSSKPLLFKRWRQNPSMKRCPDITLERCLKPYQSFWKGTHSNTEQYQNSSVPVS